MGELSGKAVTPLYLGKELHVLIVTVIKCQMYKRKEGKIRPTLKQIYSLWQKVYAESKSKEYFEGKAQIIGTRRQ